MNLLIEHIQHKSRQRDVIGPPFSEGRYTAILEGRDITRRVIERERSRTVKLWGCLGVDTPRYRVFTAQQILLFVFVSPGAVQQGFGVKKIHADIVPGMY